MLLKNHVSAVFLKTNLATSEAWSTNVILIIWMVHPFKLSRFVTQLWIKETSACIDITFEHKSPNMFKPFVSSPEVTYTLFRLSAFTTSLEESLQKHSCLGSSLSCLKRGQEKVHDVRVYNSTGRFAKTIKTEVFPSYELLCISACGQKSEEWKALLFAVKWLLTCEATNFISSRLCLFTAGYINVTGSFLHLYYYMQMF